MISKRKIIFYFGFAGLLPAIFYISREIYLGNIDTFDLDFVLKVLGNMIMGYFITAFVSTAVIYSTLPLDRLFPWEKGVWRRIVIEFFSTNFVAVLAILVVGNITYFLPLYKNSYKEHAIQGIVIAIILNLFLTTFYEGIRLFHKWKSSLVKAERLVKENVISKYEALQNQVNPHFLFNNLNTLSSLIYSDTKKAEEFIDEFASIYRYVLDNKDRFVVSLKEELKFIHSFINLYQIRFGEGFYFNIKIDSTLFHYQIPTLSLQLLVENTVKHNIVTKDHPLEVSIASDGQYIVVKNNLQIRDTENLSTGVGLENLKQRYKLITDKKPEFYIENDYYIARIPLIEPD